MASNLELTESAGGCAVTHDTAAADFVDLLIADDEWVRQEFDALVAAGWGGAKPPRPAPEQGSRWPRRPGYPHHPTPVHHPLDPVRGQDARAHQRGPPDPRAH